jgi:hypothetical protein
MPSTAEELYDPTNVDIERLADLLHKLSPEQRESLLIRLNPDAMKQLEESKADLEAGNTIPMDEW